MKNLFVMLMSLNLILSPLAIADSGSQFQTNPNAENQGGFKKIKDQVMTLAVSSVGANIMLTCTMGSMQPSLWLFMGGSLTHILTEIAAGKSIKDVHKKNAADLVMLEEKMKEGGDLQKGILLKALSEEEEKLAFVNKRLKWLKIVKTMYTAAAIVAAIEVAKEIATLGTWSSIAGCIPGNIAPPLLTRLAIVGAYTYQNAKEGGLLGSLLFLFIPVHASIVPAMYQHGGLRIATFGAAALFTNGVTNDLNEIKTTLEGNIAKLNGVINKFNIDTATDNELADASLGPGKIGVNPGSQTKTYSLKKLPTIVKSEKDCISNSGTGISVSASGCRNPLKLKRPKFDMDLELPALKNFTNQALDMTNALAEGNTDRADILGGQLETQALRMDAIKADVFKQLNDKLKAKGKKPIDFDADVKKRMAEMNAGYDKMVNANANGALASFKGQDAALGDDLKSSESLKEAILDIKEVEPVTAAVPESGISTSLGEEPSVEVEPQKVANLDESLNNYEVSESDISKDAEVSIFKQVSNRYFLNYTKIFQRKEINPPLEEPAPAP